MSTTSWPRWLHFHPQGSDDAAPRQGSPSPLCMNDMCTGSCCMVDDTTTGNGDRAVAKLIHLLKKFFVGGILFFLTGAVLDQPSGAPSLAHSTLLIPFDLSKDDTQTVEFAVDHGRDVTISLVFDFSSGADFQEVSKVTGDGSYRFVRNSQSSGAQDLSSMSLHAQWAAYRDGQLSVERPLPGMSTRIAMSIRELTTRMEVFNSEVLSEAVSGYEKARVFRLVTTKRLAAGHYRVVCRNTKLLTLPIGLVTYLQFEHPFIR